MSERLAIVEVSPAPENPPRNKRIDKKQHAQAKFERLWLLYPEKFNPERNCLNRERLNRTWVLLKNHVNIKNCKAADLGCGYASLSKRLHEEHASSVDALDVAENALKHIAVADFPRLNLIQGYLPHTLLEDSAYDLVICTDVIGEMDFEDFRLLFSELARIIKPEGKLVCSTPLDIDSEDALERFANLVDTEFDVQETLFSYHTLYIRLCDFFAAPKRFVKASHDPEYRIYGLDKRRSFNRFWFTQNSNKGPALFWKVIRPLSDLFCRWLNHATGFMLFLEKINHWFSRPDQATHVIFVGSRKPLIPPASPAEMTTVQRKGKKFVWE